MTTRRALILPLALTLSLGLVGCGVEDEPAVEETSAPETITAEQPAQETTQGAGTDGEDATGPDAAVGLGEVTEAGLAAIEAAEAETGGTAYEIDDEDGDRSWEVRVRVDDTSVEVKVAEDGTVTVEEEDDLDDDDRAGLDAASISLKMAIQAATAEVEGGVLDDAELASQGNSFHWEVTLDGTEQGDDLEVVVDAETGEVTGVEED